jgi:hypothetical protein
MNDYILLMCLIEIYAKCILYLFLTYLDLWEVYLCYTGVFFVLGVVEGVTYMQSIPSVDPLCINFIVLCIVQSVILTVKPGAIVHFVNYYRFQGKKFTL